MASIATSRSQLSIQELDEKAAMIRKNVAVMFESAGYGHYGACMSEADILAALYFRVLKVCPGEPRWPDRDRFVLSKGHGGAGLCAALALAGYFPEDRLTQFGRIDSAVTTHPDMKKTPGVDMSTGSLGQGFCAAVGMALAGRMDNASWRVFTLLGDGECDEGIVWEGAMTAAHYGLDNLIAIVDRNRLSMDGPTESLMSLEPFADKWSAFGWAVRSIDGHDMKNIVEALEAVPFVNGKPSIIIAETIKGKGIRFIENKWNWHFGSMVGETAEQARRELQINE